MNLENLLKRASGLKKFEKDFLKDSCKFAPQNMGMKYYINILQKELTYDDILCPNGCGKFASFDSSKMKLGCCSAKCGNELRKTSGVAKVAASNVKIPLDLDITGTQDIDEFIQTLIRTDGNVDGNLTKRISSDSKFSELMKERGVDLTPNKQILVHILGYKKCTCGNWITKKGSTFCSFKCSNSDPEKITKTKQVFFDKYGLLTNLSTKEIRDKNSSRMSKPLGGDHILYDKERFNTVCEGLTIQEISAKIGVAYSTAQHYSFLYETDIKRVVSTSYAEIEIASYIEALGFEPKTNVKGLLSNRRLELDIYIESHNLAIEFDGLYWHSGERKFNKYEECEKVGLNLLTIYDVEWDDIIKQDIWKSVIRHKLNATQNKIYARKCKIVDVEPRKANEFFTKNHLQGHANASVYKGLEYEGELVTCISLMKPRWDKNVDFEIIRFANKLNHHIAGGFSKLVKHIDGTYISYANRRWSAGNVYAKSGLIKEAITPPNYVWYNSSNSMLLSRYKTQKHKLQSVLGSLYNENLTENENMENSGFVQVFDYGNIKFKGSKI